MQPKAKVRSVGLNLSASCWDFVSSMSTSTSSVSATKGEKGKSKYAALNINNLYKVINSINSKYGVTTVGPIHYPVVRAVFVVTIHIFCHREIL